MMKRRNVDCVKPRRPLKRNKISEGLYGSSVVYIKFVLIWLLVLSADYLLDFRFEYLWPFWLLLRSIYDSFRYQGLAFCVLFLCMAITADMVAIIFIPASWLFFAASTYVWVQFVWHTDRGVCMPTVLLWAIFIYIEAMVRLKEVKNVPFHMDLCRPFAAHCIGYPVVTLGFGLKSYVGYRLRQRKQREVARENEFYVQLLQEALPPDLQHIKNMSNAQAQAAVVKDYEESEVVNTEVAGSASSSSAPSGFGGIGIGAWSRESCLPSLAFFTRLRKSLTARSPPATPPAAVTAATTTTRQQAKSWWRSWLNKSDNSYYNDSSHMLNSCLPNNSINNNTNNTSSGSSCSSSSSSSSSISSSCSSRGRMKDDGGGGGGGKDGGGGAHNGTATGVLTSSPPPPTATKQHKLPTALHAELEYMQKKSVSDRSVNNFDESTADRDKAAKGSDSSSQAAPTEDKPKNKTNATHSQQSNGSVKAPVSNLNVRNDTSSGGGNAKKTKNKENNRDAVTTTKDDSITVIKLEGELKRVRSEMNSRGNVEQDLRNQINSLVSSQKLCQQELTELQQDNDTLQNKLHGMVTARQTDRATLGGLERRVADERRQRQAAETQLQQLDRRNRKLEEQNQRHHQTKLVSSSSTGECSDVCRARRAELEAEVKRLRRDARTQEDKMRAMDRENVSLRQYKESQNDSEVLMSALSAMQERNNHLETTLSAETRVKLDLFSALGEAKRQLQIAQGHIDRKDKEIDELKSKITEVLAVCPATSFSSTALHTNNNPAPYHYSSKLLMPQVSNALDSSLASNLVADLNLDSLVVGLGFPSNLPPPPPAISPQLPPLTQQQPISPPTPGPISPPCSMSPANPPQLSNLDPNARIYTPKCVNGSQQTSQDN